MLARADLIEYIRYVAPWFTIEEIHLLIAEKLNRVITHDLTRLCINMQPRAGKSQMASRFFPSLYMGNWPEHQILQACYNVGLADDMGADVRDQIKEPEYRELFPEIELKADTKAKGNWKVSRRGAYRSIGIGSGAAGKGFNLGIIDDPLSEQDAYSAAARAYVRKWYGSGFLTRQQSGFNAIVLMTTRWATDDLQGHILNLAKEARERDEDGDEFEVLSIPAILDKQAADMLNAKAEECREINQEIEDEKAIKEERKRVIIEPNFFEEGESCAPRRWPKKHLMKLKSGMSSMEWEAVYQQKPSIDGGNILKSMHWREWKGKNPPKCHYVIQVYDTAFKTGEENDFTARTTWGIFKHADKDGVDRYCCILLEALEERLTFPDLRREAYRSYKEYEPDVVIIEDKASGQSLIQELKLKRVPIVRVQPKHDKIARAHAVSVILEQGGVFYMDRAWARNVIQQCAIFPKAEHDDLVDTCLIAWKRLRDLFWLEVPEDEDEDEEPEPGEDTKGKGGFYG